MTEYVTVRIPKELGDETDKLIGKYGFSSRAEVVKNALREFFKNYPETKTLNVEV